MKIGIVSNAAYSLPLLQVLCANRLQVSVFADTCNDEQSDMALMNHFCHQQRIPMQTGDAGMLYFWLEETKPDIVFVMGFRHLIDVKQVPPHLGGRMYNIHFGALPGYRGPSPVFWQIKQGAEQLTATIHHINERFDAGAAVWAKQIKREPYMSFGVATLLLSQLIIEGAGYLIQQLMQKKPIPVLAAKGGAGHYQKRPQLQDVLIQWESMDNTEIVNLVLACNPWNKGAITYLNGRDVKIVDAEVVNTTVSEAGNLPGTIIATNTAIRVVCRAGTLIDLMMLNVEGTFIPGRYADKFGFIQGQRLGMPLVKEGI